MRSRVFAVMIGIVVFAWLAMSGTAAAHAEFESSTPSDGSTQQEPLGEIIVAFSSEVEPTGEGFVVLDGSGTTRTPTSATSSDGQTWTLSFEPPLAGAVGVRWNVKAPDAHPISGTFSFEVSEREDVAADGSQAIGSGDAGPAGDDPAAENEPARAGPDSGAVSTSLDEFLAGDSSAAGVDTVQGAARALVVVGAIVSIGALVFAGAVLQGSAAEVRGVIFWVRRGGLMVMVGAIIDFAGQVAIESAGWGAALDIPEAGSVMSSSFGVATALRILGGWGLLRTAPIVSATTGRTDPVVAIASRVPALVGTSGEPPPSELSGLDVDSPEPPPMNAGARVHSWYLNTDAAPAVGGAVALLVAFTFHGHTAVEGPRLVTATADIAHVGAGATWAGGLAMLCLVLWRRRRRGLPLGGYVLAGRFSVVASLAVVVAGLAGIALAVTILDSISELWTTQWGQLLVAKSLLVAIAGAAGGYNHLVLIPALSRDPHDEELNLHLRKVVTVEAALFVAVGIVTAALIGAAS